MTIFAKMMEVGFYTSASATMQRNLTNLSMQLNSGSMPVSHFLKDINHIKNHFDCQEPRMLELPRCAVKNLRDLLELDARAYEMLSNSTMPQI